MNGRAARALRRSELPADLRAEVAERIAVAASARHRSRQDARKTYDEAERGIARVCAAAQREADEVFERARAEILDEFSRRAEERAAA